MYIGSIDLFNAFRRDSVRSCREWRQAISWFRGRDAPVRSPAYTACVVGGNEQFSAGGGRFRWVVCFAAAAFFLLVLVIMPFASQASAHPGRTDSSGRHMCRTNCASWGLSYGEYHSHNSVTTGTATSSSAASDSGSDTGTWLLLGGGAAAFLGLIVWGNRRE